MGHDQIFQSIDSPPLGATMSCFVVSGALASRKDSQRDRAITGPAPPAGESPRAAALAGARTRLFRVSGGGGEPDADEMAYASGESGCPLAVSIR